jgi:hypothetical protein
MSKKLVMVGLGLVMGLYPALSFSQATCPVVV